MVRILQTRFQVRVLRIRCEIAQLHIETQMTNRGSVRIWTQQCEDRRADA
jgi:hypothetical protein